MVEIDRLRSMRLVAILMTLLAGWLPPARAQEGIVLAREGFSSASLCSDSSFIYVLVPLDVRTARLSLEVHYFTVDFGARGGGMGRLAWREPSVVSPWIDFSCDEHGEIIRASEDELRSLDAGVLCRSDGVRWQYVGRTGPRFWMIYNRERDGASATRPALDADLHVTTTRGARGREHECVALGIVHFDNDYGYVYFVRDGRFWVLRHVELTDDPGEMAPVDLIDGRLRPGPWTAAPPGLLRGLNARPSLPATATWRLESRGIHFSADLRIVPKR
jgi:hypothetical protein